MGGEGNAEAGQVREEILNSFIEDASFRGTFTVREATVFPPDTTGIRTIYKNIFEHEKMILRILIPEVVQPIRASDPPLLEILSQYVRRSILQSQLIGAENVRTMESILFQLLDHQPVEDYLFRRTMDAYGWTPDHAYLCTKLVVDKLDIQNNTTAALVSALKQLVPDACVFEFQKNIVMYINLGDRLDLPDPIAETLKAFIRDNNLKAGISSGYHGFLHIYQCLYQQAEQALSVGLRYMPFKWIHRFEEIADKYLLEKCTEDLPANMLCAPEILAMCRHDQLYNTEYRYTLKTYLENNMQPVMTAKKLFIHRTTLLYRLDKMTTLFQLRLSDPDRRFFYQLSMLLLEQMHHDSNGIT